MPDGKDKFYSTKNISLSALDEIKQTLQNMEYGSVELFVCNSEITQITKRVIRKTNGKPELTKGEKAVTQ